MLCRELSLVKHEPGSIRVSPLYCRSWTCEVCAPKRQAQLVRTAIDGRPDCLITLTVNPDFGTSPADRAAKLADAWRAFRRRHVRQHSQDPLPFLAIFEHTENGEPHLHIIGRVKWIEQKELSRFMGARIAAPVVDIRRVRSRKGVARYVCKYTAKEPIRFGTCKRYWHTPGWTTWRKHYREQLRKRGVRFEVSHCRLAELIADARSTGFMPEPDHDGFVIRFLWHGPAPPHMLAKLVKRRAGW